MQNLQQSQDLEHIMSMQNQSINDSPNFTQDGLTSKFKDAYGTLNERIQVPANVPQTIMDMERDHPYNYTMNNSNSMEMDDSAPPSVPIGSSPEKDMDK
jgi:hypothetical protein